MKYIIDIPTEMDEATARYWNETTDMTLVPYTEPDRKVIEDEVWAFASMLMNMHPDVAEDIYWSMNGGKGIGVAAEMTYQDAKAKYESWKKQKDEIHIGDEVKGNSGLWTGVVVGFDEFDALIIMDSSGKSCGGYKTKYFRKTGRHFNEVAELLKKMRDTE